MGGDGTYFTQGKPGGPEDVVYYYTGSDREFPADSELPIEVLRQAVKEFLDSGGERPNSPTWQDWREGVD